MSTPAAAAARATEARIVSTEVRMPSSLSVLMTGTTRRFSTSASTRTAPGRVDSPPTSIMSAPCATSSRAWLMAASTSNHLPPSEKESSVTLTMPITSVRLAMLRSDTEVACCMACSFSLSW